MGGGRCELCRKEEARMYCESDQAKLCWECDHRVHSANFLVEKHSRVLLCHVCHSLTPWKASGPKLGRTVSICHHCFSAHANNTNSKKQLLQHQENQELTHQDCINVVSEEDEEYENWNGDSEESDDDEEEEEEGENQVVPWSCGSPTEPLPHNKPPVVDGSSKGDENLSRFSGSKEHHVLGFKRARNIGVTDLDSDNEIGCSSTHMNSHVTLRPLKQTRTSNISHVEVD